MTAKYRIVKRIDDTGYYIHKRSWLFWETFGWDSTFEEAELRVKAYANEVISYYDKMGNILNQPINTTPES